MPDLGISQVAVNPTPQVQDWFQYDLLGWSAEGNHFMADRDYSTLMEGEIA
jgi:hypothetical protein